MNTQIIKYLQVINVNIIWNPIIYSCGKYAKLCSMCAQMSHDQKMFTLFVIY